MSNMPENIRRMWEEAANIKGTRPEPPDVKSRPTLDPKHIQFPSPEEIKQLSDDARKSVEKRPTLPKGKPMVPPTNSH